jgi:hypothetical protein
MFILADAGVPMLTIEWPVMIMALVPIIAIEAALFSRWLALSWRRAFIGSAKANLLSTLIGVPLAWLAMFALELLVMYPVSVLIKRGLEFKSPVWELLGFLASIAWLAPVESKLYWMVPAAAALLLVPTFYLSVVLERRVCVANWPDADAGRVRRAVLRANLVTYGILFLLAVALLSYSIATDTGPGGG